MAAAPDRAAPSEGIALVLLAIVAAPLMLLIGYGGDVPPSAGCGDEPTPQAVIDRYRDGAGGIIAVAEVVALAAYAVAVRRSVEVRSRVLDASLALTAAGAGAIGATWLLATASTGVPVGVLGGIATAALVWLGLRLVARRPPTLLAATLALALAVPLALAGWLLAFLAYLGPPLVLVPAGVIGAVVLGAAMVRRTWSAAALAAAYVAVVIIPLGGLVILTRGHDAPFC